jgi:bacterioferritin
MDDMNFAETIEGIRERVREETLRGAVTPAYKANVEKVCAVLNEVLATEIVCALRYHNNRFVALQNGDHRVAEEFAEHAREEEQHQHQVAERISQLGGTPDFDPRQIVDRAHAAYTTSNYLRELLQENLVAERIAVATYSEIIRWLGDDDPTTRRMMEDILAQEEEHADDLVDLIRSVDSRS